MFMSKSKLFQELLKIQEESEEQFDIICEWKGNRIIIEYKQD